MATLAQETISVTLPGYLVGFLNRKAERDKRSVPTTLASIVAGVMEDEEDEISDEEDRRLSELVDEAERNTAGFYTLDEVMEELKCRIS